MCARAAAQQSVHPARHTQALQTSLCDAADSLRVMALQRAGPYSICHDAMREGPATARQSGTHLAFCRFAPMAACSPMPCCPGMRG